MTDYDYVLWERTISLYKTLAAWKWKVDWAVGLLCYPTFEV